MGRLRDINGREGKDIEEEVGEGDENRGHGWLEHLKSHYPNIYLVSLSNQMDSPICISLQQPIHYTIQSNYGSHMLASILFHPFFTQSSLSLSPLVPSLLFSIAWANPCGPDSGGGREGGKTDGYEQQMVMATADRSMHVR